MKSTKLIIDCDPGHDDAIALLLALCEKQLDIIGVTAVSGNSTLEHTFLNARTILAFAHRSEIPVYAGCTKPLARPLQNQEGAKVHGEDGLGNLSLEVDLPAPLLTHAVDFLTSALINSAEKITLVCLGPLTNIATALIRTPQCREKIEKIIIMGGAVHTPGNVTPYSEFNFYIDPEAANIVLQSGCDILLHPLDVTMKALLYKKDIDALLHSGHKALMFAGELLLPYAKSYEQELGYYACPIHDALCIATLIEPSLIEYEEIPLTVRTDGKYAGQCIFDSNNITLKSGINIDRERFVSMLSQKLSSLPL